MTNKLKCKKCGMVLNTSMEVEYSRWVNEFFCSPDCALDYYFNYMDSAPVDFDNIPEDNIAIDGNGDLYEISS